jgi:septal ring factor EnvC (AmiA/AmiB activator)
MFRGFRFMSIVALGSLAAAVLAAPGVPGAVAALGPAPQDPAQTEAQARRATDRLQALQREAEALAAQETTLLGELRQLEIERDIQNERLKTISSDLDAVMGQINQASLRIDDLERQRASRQPGLASRLVELYKLGKGGYLRMLLGVNDLRQIGRAYRTVAAIAERDRQQIEEDRRAVEALQAERGRLEQRRSAVAKLEQQARAARTALDHATESRAALVAQIDARRDLNARLAGELQAAQRRLQQTLAAVASGASVEPVVLPLGAFQHDLDWPTAGRVSGRFGRRSGAGSASSSNGVEIATAEGASVRAVHEGTVAYAEPFTGYGNLVILDHGGQSYSLYGYLGSLDVTRGARVERGESLGTVGQPPTGGSALYFELRIDGKPVDPVEWLRRR